VINWATITKLEYVELSVLTQNKNAIEMYEKMDFVECSKVMRMNL
jgi:ribosomal protein S18 acetylase RimI-like enzyme